MILELLNSVVSSFIGTFAFALILHAPKESWLVCSMLGSVSYGTYTLLRMLGAADALAMFLGVLLASSIAQIMAKRRRMIATVFVTLSIIPCVPGYGIYTSMSLFARDQMDAGMQAFVTAMTEVVMIALALAISSFVARSTKKIKK